MLEPTSRYPSVAMRVHSDDEPSGTGLVTIDGFEVVEEKVVLLSPVDAAGSDVLNSPMRRTRSRHNRSGDDYGLG